jgi:ATP-dependent DNA helicase RecG
MATTQKSAKTYRWTHWEMRPAEKYTLKDLDHKRIKEIVQAGVISKRMPDTLTESLFTARVPTMLRRLSLLVDDQVTKAAVMLFCKKEAKPPFCVSLEYTVNSKKKIERITGNLFDLYDKTMQFFDTILPAHPTCKDLIVPHAVLHEAICNALVHRDYSNPAHAISITVSDSKIVIYNPSALLGSSRVKELTKEHDSIPHNPWIARIFFSCAKMTLWGRGTVEMIRECKAVGNPLPIYEETTSGFLVTFPFKEPIQLRKTIAKKASPKTRSTRTRMK